MAAGRSHVASARVSNRRRPEATPDTIIADQLRALDRSSNLFDAHLVTIMFAFVLVFTLTVPVPVALMFAVSFSTVIPMMIVFDSAAISGPITHKILVALMTRRHPISALIRWPGPVSLMPSVMPSHWIPIPLHPHKPFSWRRRLNVNDTRRRRCADCDTN
jgi:hypothetical protein